MKRIRSRSGFCNRQRHNVARWEWTVHNIPDKYEHRFHTYIPGDCFFCIGRGSASSHVSIRYIRRLCYRSRNSWLPRRTCCPSGRILRRRLHRRRLIVWYNPWCEWRCLWKLISIRIFCPCWVYTRLNICCRLTYFSRFRNLRCTKAWCKHVLSFIFHCFRIIERRPLL